MLEIQFINFEEKLTSCSSFMMRIIGVNFIPIFMFNHMTKAMAEFDWESSGVIK